MAVPKIRIKGYTDEWSEKLLSQIATMHARIGWQNLRKDEFLSDGDYYLITGTDFIDGNVNYKTCHYVDEERYNQDKNIQLKNGSILVTKDGTLGKVAYIEKLDKPATLNAGVFNIVCRTKHTDSRYLFQYLKSPLLMNYVYSTAIGGTIKHLNQNVLVKFPINMPCFDEQVILGKFFQSLDSLIEATGKKIATLKQTKQASLQSMFPQEGETKPRVRFKGFEGDWKKVTLGDIADIYQPQTIGANYFTEKGYDVYGANGIIGKYTEYNHITNQSMIACRGSNCGVVNHSQGKCWINGNAMVINVDNYDIYKLFMYFLLQNQDFSSIISGSGQPQIVRGPLQQWNLLIPFDTEEQQTIASYFQNLDNQITLQTQRLEKLKQIKSACLKNMFV